MRLNLLNRFFVALFIISLGSAAYAEPGGSQSSARKGKGSDKPAYQHETQTREQSREKAPDKGEQARTQAEAKERVRDPEQGKGNETSAEKQAQRQERKQIQEEYRTGDKQSGEGKAKKKPWWKFWEGDESG